jgi:hypothetical protein
MNLEERIARLEAAQAKPYGPDKSSKSLFSLRTTGGTYGGAYPAGVLHSGITPISAAFTSGYLLCLPFYMPDVPNIVVKIGINVTVPYAGKSFRLGIYKDKGEPRLFPHKLVVDAGEVSAATTGVKSITIRRGLPRGLYWVALLGNDATTVRIATFATGDSSWAVLGHNETGDACYVGVGVYQAYGALPDPFPTGGAEYAGTTGFPYIFLTFGV